MTGNQTDLKLDWVCFVCPHCLYGQQGVKLSWWTLDIRLCTHLRQLKETGMLNSGWQMYTVACVRIMKNVEVREYCLGWHVYALWKKKKIVQVHEYCLGWHVRTFCTLICKLIIIKLMVAVVMLFIFICPFIFILFVCPVSVKCPVC